MLNVLNSKLIGEVDAFTHSTVWALLKYRLSNVYLDRLKESLVIHVRNEDWHKASRFEGKIDAVREFVEITEHLAKEIEDEKLDVDIALGVIENKAREERIKEK